MGNSSEIIHLKPEPDLDPEPKKVSEHGPITTVVSVFTAIPHFEQYLLKLFRRV